MAATAQRLVMGVGAEGGRVSTAAGYAGVALFVALEARVREWGSASSLDASEDDRGTTRRIVAAYVLAAFLSPALRRVRRGRLPPRAASAGLALEASGLVLRAWSMRTLRASYSRTLRVEVAQRVTDSGPYAAIRHPGYLGSLLTWIGFALISRSGPVVAVVAGLLGGAYRRRITAEEELLRRDLPGYLEYAARTKRLVPFVW